MTCGSVTWNIKYADEVLDRFGFFGAIEHLLVQFDFLTQLEFDGRAEYSVPASSKKRKGQVGFADIVSVNSKSIWEIKHKFGKPTGGYETIGHQASAEAKNYVDKAKVHCGANWILGSNFKTKDKNGVVYTAEAEGLRLELVAEQSVPGAVLYYWRRNGDTLRESLRGDLYFYLRQKIIIDYFANTQKSRPPPGSDLKYGVSPFKWQALILRSENVVPQLKKFLPSLFEGVKAFWGPRLPEGCAIAICVDDKAFSRLVGAQVVAIQKEWLSTKIDPSLELARALTLAQGASISVFGVPYLIAGVTLVGALATMAIVELVLPAAAAASQALRPIAPAIAAVPHSFAASLSRQIASQIPRLLATGTASLISFVIPGTAAANANELHDVEVFVPIYELLSPSEARNIKFGSTLPAKNPRNAPNAQQDVLRVIGIATTLDSTT